MDTHQLNRHGRMMLPGTFRGVYPAHSLPRVTKYPYAFIANTDRKHKAGDHWVVFYFDRNGQGHHFDSFGRNPLQLHKDWAEYLKMHGTTADYDFNTRKVQHKDKDTCGLHCLLYLHKRRLKPVDLDSNITRGMNDTSSIAWAKNKGIYLRRK